MNLQAWMYSTLLCLEIILVVSVLVTKYNKFVRLSIEIFVFRSKKSRKKRMISLDMFINLLLWGTKMVPLASHS